MRKKLIIIYIIFLFFAFPVYAGMFLPEIVVNDNLKLCRLYDPNPKEYELPNDWKYIKGNSDDVESICTSLGYRYEKGIWPGSLKLLYRNTNIIISIILGMLMLYLFYIIIKESAKAKNKKFYIPKLILKIITTILLIFAARYLIIMFVYNYLNTR